MDDTNGIPLINTAPVFYEPLTPGLSSVPEPLTPGLSIAHSYPPDFLNQQTPKNMFRYWTVGSAQGLPRKDKRVSSFDFHSTIDHQISGIMTPKKDHSASIEGSHIKWRYPETIHSKVFNISPKLFDESEFHSFANRTCMTLSTIGSSCSEYQKYLDDGNRLSYSEILLGIFLPPF
jgi:hypothetical protein